MQATSFLQRRPRELLYCKTPSDALPDLFGLVNEVEFFSKIRITDYFLELTRSFRTNLVIQDQGDTCAKGRRFLLQPRLKCFATKWRVER